MIGNLPDGTPIGRMKASISWILSHTARFAGVVIITIQDGSGFILIDTGKPLYFSFRQGKRTLEGNNAYDYFHSFPVISFELRRYDAREMAEAVELIQSAGVKPGPVEPPVGDLNTVDFLLNAHNRNGMPGIRAAFPDLTDPPEIGSSREDMVPDEIISAYADPKGKTAGIAGENPAEIPQEDILEDTVEIRQENTRETPQEDVLENSVEIRQENTRETPQEDVLENSVEIRQENTRETPKEIASEETVDIAAQQKISPEKAEMFGIYPACDYTDEGMLSRVGGLLLGQLLSIPGVLAVSIFNRDMHVLSLGDVNLEHLVDAAEDLMYSAHEVSSVLEMGPFVQMTLQLPSGNVIIVPYWDEYLCILTSPDINLGQVRKIVRDIPPGHQATPRKA